MKKRKLKGFVLPTAYVIGVTVIFLSVMYIGSNIRSFYDTNNNLVTGLFTRTIAPVISEQEEAISKPFTNEKVEIDKYFYNKDDEDTNKESSIIYYQDTYMQNTGILYSSDEQFDVNSCLSGTVTSIKEDEILGSVIFVEYNTKVTVVYYTVEGTTLKVGDKIEANTVIGKSSTNKLETQKKYNLLLEVYINGNLVNPLDFYEMNIDDLNS